MKSACNVIVVCSVEVCTTAIACETCSNCCIQRPVSNKGLRHIRNFDIISGANSIMVIHHSRIISVCCCSSHNCGVRWVCSYIRKHSFWSAESHECHNTKRVFKRDVECRVGRMHCAGHCHVKGAIREVCSWQGVATSCIQSNDTLARCRACPSCISAHGPVHSHCTIARDRNSTSCTNVRNCRSSCLCGVHVLVDHLSSESNLREVHDSVDCHSGCTDDLRGETDVKLRDFNVTRSHGVN